MNALSKVKVAIVGSGPAGLSAAAHAAELGLSYVLLESGKEFSNTIQSYQKRKRVMAEPGELPLRSPVVFEAGSREDVLDAWSAAIDKYQINIWYQAEVKGIEGSQGNFILHLANDRKLNAEFVVLAIGTAGNPRKLGVPGDELPYVEYTLRDPDEFKNESIVVIGAGDAAIENALALAKQNQVFIVNRRAEFSRAKSGNLSAILRAIEDDQLTCHYQCNTATVEETPGSDRPCLITLKDGEDKEIKIPCNRIIARLGGVPPRRFVESCGVKFPNDEPGALPELSSKYESNVAGLYIIGALGGYPLIKQAMNQGYEVIEYILGNEIEPADHGLLQNRLTALPYELSVDECLSLLRERIPFFSTLNPLLFRELMLESTVHVFEKGDRVFNRGDATTSIYTILDGEISLESGTQKEVQHTTKSGEIIGELSLISGQRRPNTAIARVYSILIETPRRTMVKLIASVDSVRIGIDRLFVSRAIQESFTPALSIDEIQDVAGSASLEQFKPGQCVYEEKDQGDDIHLVRKGAVVLSRLIDNKERILRQVRAGQYFGDISLMNVGYRVETAKAAVATETTRLSKDAFLNLIKKDNSLIKRFQVNLSQNLLSEADTQAEPRKSAIVDFLIQHGAGEATDLLIINETLCVGCDNCEMACAETHQGISRLDRKLGPSFSSLHIATACRHCENPHCMKDCPTNAILRAADGEVFINDDKCIGCGNCKNNCPYGVIQLTGKRNTHGGLLSWLLTGLGQSPGEKKPLDTEEGKKKKAVKCDLCKDDAAGPACVRACPTGAAKRIKPLQFDQLIGQHTF